MAPRNVNFTCQLSRCRKSNLIPKCLSIYDLMFEVSQSEGFALIIEIQGLYSKPTPFDHEMGGNFKCDLENSIHTP